MKRFLKIRLNFTTLLFIGFIVMLAISGILYIKVQNLTGGQVRGIGSHSVKTIAPVPTPSLEFNRQQIIKLINERRLENGLSPLKESSLLNESALLKAQDMLSRNYWDHKSPDGVEPWRFFQKVGYNYQHAGENLARSYYGEIPSVSVENWMKSPTHKEVMLDSRYSEIGIGFVIVPVTTSLYVEGGKIIVAHFGSQKKTYDESAIRPNEAASRTGNIVPYHDWCNNRDISVYENEIIVKRSSDGNVYGMTNNDWDCYERFLSTKK